jgi:hypothetical protein
VCDGTPCPCNLIEPAIGVDGVPWASVWRRCRARLEPGAEGAGAYYGRCDLRAHSPKVDHALERGMDVVRFRTAVTATVPVSAWDS